MSEETQKALAVALLPFVFAAMIFGAYLFLGFVNWITTDPLDLFQDGYNWYTRPFMESRITGTE